MTPMQNTTAPSDNNAKDRRRLLLAVGLAGLLAALVGSLIVWQSEQRRLEAARTIAAQAATDHVQHLDQTLQQALSATYALAALVRQGQGEIDNFEETARQMLQIYPAVSALQLAPNGIIRDIVPLAGNEPAIGHDLLKDPARTKEAFLARDTGKLTLAGPFKLLQGGMGVVGRLPVFLPDAAGGTRFWGFTTVLVRFPEAIESAGLGKLLRDGYHYRLWRIHPDSGERQTIAASLDALAAPVERTLTVPNGEWTLSVAPIDGWDDPGGLALKLGLAALFVFLFTLTAAIQFRQPLLLRREVERRTRELREREAMLRSMNELSSDWFWTQDADYRFTSLTSGMERIVGLKPDQLIGRCRWDLDTTLNDAEWAAHRGLLEARQPFRDFVYGIRRDDGEVRYISVSGEPVFDELGAFAGYRGTGRNITARKLAEQRLVESEARFQQMFEEAPVAMSVTTEADGFVATRWNSAWLHNFGYPPETAQGKSGNQLGLWVIPQERDDYNSDASRYGATQPREVRMRRANGDIRQVAVSGRMVTSGGQRMLLTTYDDITERRQAENRLRDSLQRLELHISATPLAVIDWDADFRVVAWNPAAERIFGYRRDEAIGQHASFIVPERYRHRVDGVMKALFSRSESHRSTDTNVTKNGATIECEWYNAPITDASGRTVALSSLVHDVTDRLKYMRALEYQAHHDPLTQLYNRNWLAAEIDRHIADTPEVALDVIFIDLDRFKEINDTLGHRIGDELLIQLASRLKATLERDGCQVARLGGDEFAVLAPDSAIDRLAPEILQTLRQPVELSGMNLEVGAGVGIARYPLHGADAASLMRCADIAMYHAKDTAQSYTVYSPAIDTYSQDQLTLMNDLRSAIRNDELQLYFQPKVGLAGETLVGYETLLRWRHPLRGMVPPGHFIPHAEFTDLMRPLTHWVIEGALRQWRTWADDGHETSVAINLSSRNLLEDGLPDDIGRLLGAYRVAPELIEFEITESAIMADPEKAMSILHRLRNLGVTLSIDDFGTGYSSLAYLRRLPVQKLKIDASFVMGMHHNREDRIIVESTIGLAHNLGLKVVAEGVESEASLALLAELGCDEAQGYFFSRPLPPDELERWRLSPCPTTLQ
ncbi:EAL domain-containing protein [Azospira restricta]|uniref:EAL domain-containing protein n=1 Tax=Azospira restricta TaxID=404405 RepID=A0A974PVR1_9RHOO|nr:EAL domain-containing protein [Azospira restricta]QRJ62402.1 EAL domain-containing protein [Azospira restricta]